MSSKSSISHQRRMYRCLGHLQRKASRSRIYLFFFNVGETNVLLACFPLPLHFTMAKGQIGLSPRQQRLGVPKVRPVDEARRKHIHKGREDEKHTLYRTRTRKVCGISFQGWFKLHAVFRGYHQRRGLALGGRHRLAIMSRLC